MSDDSKKITPHLPGDPSHHYVLAVFAECLWVEERDCETWPPRHPSLSSLANSEIQHLSAAVFLSALEHFHLRLDFECSNKLAPIQMKILLIAISMASSNDLMNTAHIAVSPD